jgi:hypothetical protein
MTSASAYAGPRFDESLASVGRSLHVVEVTLCAFAAAWLLFAWLERRGRVSWTRVPVAARSTASGGPYRSTTLVAGHLARAPSLVRAAAFASLAFAHVSVPLILLALVRYPFDGIAVPLVPGLALASMNWCCGWMLLSRSRLAASAARSAAVGSLMANVGLVAIAGAHLVMVELQRRDGIEHACSSSVTFVVLLFAVGSIVQALLTIAALRAHERVLSAEVTLHRPPLERDLSSLET